MKPHPLFEVSTCKQHTLENQITVCAEPHGKRSVFSEEAQIPWRAYQSLQVTEKWLSL